MSEASEETLKRVFAQAPVVGADEGFVALLGAAAGARRQARRVRRIVLLTLLPIAAVGVAILLAPLALTMSVSSIGNALLGLPDQLGASAQSASHLPGALYIGLTLAAIVLPLAGAAWLSRRL